jgi:hypothetical protein
VEDVRRLAGRPRAFGEKEIEALSSAAEAAVKALRRDPLRLSQVEADLQADLSAFKEKGKRPRKN